MQEEDVRDLPRGKIIAEMFEEFWEDVPGYLDGPVFLTGHPVEISPLSKRDPEDLRITRRFEGYINGWEVCNAFSDFKKEALQRKKAVKTGTASPKEFTDWLYQQSLSLIHI